jgi:hypothetical protein
VHEVPAVKIFQAKCNIKDLVEQLIHAYTRTGIYQGQSISGRITLEITINMPVLHPRRYEAQSRSSSFQINTEKREYIRMSELPPNESFTAEPLR